jgi:isocitrate dehydrogenase
MISNRGLKVWPDVQPDMFYTDHWRARFEGPASGEIDHSAILHLLERIRSAGLEFIKIENLYRFGDELGYSLGQGQ